MALHDGLGKPGAGAGESANPLDRIAKALEEIVVELRRKGLKESDAPKEHRYQGQPAGVEP